MSNVYLFTGPETYLLDKELLRWKDTFLGKFGKESLFVFGLESMDFGQIKQTIYGGGLFTTKKLVIIHGLPLDTLSKLIEEKRELLDIFIEDFIKREGKIPEDALLIFVSSTPDKRGRLFKFLEKNAQVKKFEQLKGSDLEKFVLEQLAGFTIDHESVQYFLTKVGSNMYRIRSECEKLRYRSESQNSKYITQQTIDTVVFGQVETDVFLLMTTWLKDPARAVLLLEKIHQEDREWNLFAGSLYWSLKLYIYMIDLYDLGVRDSKEIASTLSMNPRQISNQYKQIGLLKESEKKIKALYHGLVQLDVDIKSGKVPDSYFRLGMKRMLNA